MLAVISLSSSCFFFYCYRDHRDLHSFPTRRSSDLHLGPASRRRTDVGRGVPIDAGALQRTSPHGVEHRRVGRDRKSTRLNSSHPSISYAVFCLKKKKTKTKATTYINKTTAQPQSAE